MTVSVRSARPSLKYCLIREDSIDSALENQRDLIWPPHVQVIPNDALKPHPACLRPVEDASVRDFELAKRHFVPVSSSPVGLGERGWQTAPPAREKALHCSRAEPLTGFLQFDCIPAGAESVVQGFVANTSFLQLAFGPLMSV